MSIMEMYRDNYFDANGRKYENHVKKFIEYLRIVDKLDTPTMIGLDDVSGCVGHYANLGKINYRASMESHLESLKSFYDYLNENGKADDIFSQMNYENFKMDLCKKFNLSEGNEREIFSPKTVMLILTELDDMLDSDFEFGYEIKEYEKYMQKVILRLFIKLTLIAPAKKSVICNIKLDDFSDDYRSVRINSLDIVIPNGLRRDIRDAIKLVKKIGKKNICKSESLFQYISCKEFKMTSINNWFCSFLKETDIIEDIDKKKTTYEVEPFMKTAIKAMLERMVNPAIISIISGIKIASIEDKYYDNNSIRMGYTLTINQAVNWEIAKNEYYSYI